MGFHRREFNENIISSTSMLDSCIFQTYNNDAKSNDIIIEGDFLTCLKTWAFLTKSPFYDHPNFKLPFYFGVLCFNYSLAGLFMIYIQKPKFMNNKTCYSRFFPYYAYAYLLMFLQGPLSFLADYINMNKSSIFHAIDRFLAMPLCALELIKIILLLRYSKQKKCYLWAYGISFFMAIYSFIQSQGAQTNKNVDGFIFWHCMWHLYPLAAIMTVYTESKLSGTKNVKNDRKDHHPALSDLVLEKMSSTRK